MAIEKSSGAIIFRRSAGKIYYLLIQYGLGHWEFPRGNLAKGEGWQDAAVREIREETGIKDVTFVPGFKEVSKYFYKKDKETIFKIVTYFLAETTQEKIDLSYEHQDYSWLEYKSALKRVTYKEAKKVLQKADRVLSKEGCE